MKKPQPNTEAPESQDPSELRQTALRLLTRREHSHRELQGKLLGRGFAIEEINRVVAELARQGLLSNTRFAEQYIHSRVEKGFGPVRIRAELRERGLDDETVASLLQAGPGVWEERALAARRKRFGQVKSGNVKERARQTRFLQQRGYTQDQIHSALNDEE